MFELIPFGRSRVSVFDPFREMEEMERRFFGSMSAPTVSGFRTDVTDEGDSYKLEAELPGFSKDDIKLDLENDCLTISAERSYDKQSDEKSSYVHRERYYGAYSRSFDMSGIDTDAIDAEYKDGVLRLNLPKKAPVTPPTRRLEIR